MPRREPDMKQFGVIFDWCMGQRQLEGHQRSRCAGVFCAYAAAENAADCLPEIRSARLLYVGHANDVCRDIRELLKGGAFNTQLEDGESLWFTVASGSLHDSEAVRARVAGALIHAYAPVCNDEGEYLCGDPTAIITGGHNWNLCISFTVYGNEPHGYLRDLCTAGN